MMHSHIKAALKTRIEECAADMTEEQITAKTQEVMGYANQWNDEALKVPKHMTAYDLYMNYAENCIEEAALWAMQTPGK